MKDALFYSLRRLWPDITDFEVVAVTTNEPRNWHGRRISNQTRTHGTHRELYGKFETAESATEVIVKLQAIKDKHSKPVAEALKAYIEAQNAEWQELDALIKSVTNV